MNPIQLTQLLGNIDIYLFDQLLKGRLLPYMRVLDAGCGSGRNSKYLLKAGFEIYGIDQSEKAIVHLQEQMEQKVPDFQPERFTVGNVDNMPYPNAHFDWITSNAVLHFAKNPAHFEAMIHEMMRVLKPTGILFARLASDIGMGGLVEPLENGWYHLPDGSNRFLVNELKLVEMTRQLNAHFIEPIKTTNVQNLRAMTTWVIQKNG